MPFKSQAQSRLMHAAAQDPGVARKTGVPVSVAREFVQAGHGQKVGKLPNTVEEKGEPRKGHAAEERKEPQPKARAAARSAQFSLPRERRK